MLRYSPKPDVTAESRRQAPLSIAYALSSGRRAAHGVWVHVRRSGEMFRREDAQRENRPTCNCLVYGASGRPVGAVPPSRRR